MGQKLQQLLDENEISQALLAYRTGLTTKHINQLVKGKAALSVEVALLIEEKFPQIDAFHLLMLQLRQDIARVKMRRKKAAAEGAEVRTDAEPPRQRRLVEYAPGEE